MANDSFLTPTQSWPASQPREPKSVLLATEVNFGMLITGYLSAAAFDTHLNCLIGVVFRDSRCRFEDGAFIRTSSVERRWEQEGYTLFRTFSGSNYVVCDWTLQEMGSRFSHH
ncbi:hypothetical protein [Pseudomonas hunanensis]|uniref:hypothetical protein n=1 Tax=Pseudomonas hunanensis TaxID=1247546 RepID=UPI0030DC2F2A